jgi:hypothetical protein
MVKGDTEGRDGEYVGLAGEDGCLGGVRVWSAELRAKSGLEEMKWNGIIVSTRGVYGRNREASCRAPSSHVDTTVAGLCFRAPRGMYASETAMRSVSCWSSETAMRSRRSGGTAFQQGRRGGAGQLLLPLLCAHCPPTTGGVPWCGGCSISYRRRERQLGVVRGTEMLLLCGRWLGERLDGQLDGQLQAMCELEEAHHHGPSQRGRPEERVQAVCRDTVPPGAASLSHQTDMFQRIAGVATWCVCAYAYV